MQALWVLLGLAFLIGIAIHYFWWIAAVCALWAAFRALEDASQAAIARRAAAAAEQARIIAQADQQHTWVCAGDERGIYGEHHDA